MSKRKDRERRKLNGVESEWWRKIARPLLSGDQAEAEAQFLHVLDQARRKDVAKWTPFQLCPNAVDANLSVVAANPDGAPVYVNSRYQVVVYPPVPTPVGRIVHLCFKSHENDAYHDWRDMQRIKNELVGPEYDAVEIYPMESKLADSANQYHLWVLLDAPVPFGFGERLVGEIAAGFGRQRPWEPGERPKDCLTQEQFDAKLREAAEKYGAENIALS